MRKSFLLGTLMLISACGMKVDRNSERIADSTDTIQADLRSQLVAMNEVMLSMTKVMQSLQQSLIDQRTGAGIGDHFQDMANEMKGINESLAPLKDALPAVKTLVDEINKTLLLSEEELLEKRQEDIESLPDASEIEEADDISGTENEQKKN